MTEAAHSAGDPGREGPDCLEIVRYGIRLAINPVEASFLRLYGGSIGVTCSIAVRNTGPAPCPEIPLVLYRLLKATGAADESGAPVRFRQAVRDHDPNYGRRYQVNVVTLRPDRPLAPDEERQLTVEYSGPVCGRPESLAYVWDHVGWDYTLLRWEVNWYPTIAYASPRHPPFTYRTDISVPVPLVAVTEGRLLASEEAQGRRVYSYESERAHSADFSVAAAPFQQRQVGDARFYFLPNHAQGVDIAAKALAKAEELCDRWVGPLRKALLRVVEVPQEYGSQACPGLILQQAAAFNTGGEGEQRAYRRALGALGHEAIHRWHHPPAEAERSRWLDEGIAHYFEALLVREEFGEDAYCDAMEGYRQRLLSGGPEALGTPIAEAASSEAVDEISRGKGPWVLYTLHQWLGDEAFFGIMRAWFQSLPEGGATLADFVAVAKGRSPEELGRFFEDWFYGTESSAWLRDGLPVADIIARYR